MSTGVQSYVGDFFRLFKAEPKIKFVKCVIDFMIEQNETNKQKEKIILQN